MNERERERSQLFAKERKWVLIYLITLLRRPPLSTVAIDAGVAFCCRTQTGERVAQGVDLGVQVVAVPLFDEVVCGLRLGDG